jgi:hypothetical protein
MTISRRRTTLVALLALALPAASAAPAGAASRDELQSTLLISRSLDGKVPNGASTHPVISNDKRYSRAIAFESEASDLVVNDTNGVKDVFAVLRTGSIGNTGTDWRAGRTMLISRTAGGAPANGPSFAPAIDGAFHSRPRCVGFISSASNIVAGDTNGVDDAFVTPLSGGAPRRISLPRGRQSTVATTQVAVSGNCKRIAFVAGGKMYVARAGKKRPKLVWGKGAAADPSFSTGLRTDLVFGAPNGVYLSKNGSARPRLVAPGGRNPAYNDIKRQVVTYERTIDGRSQIGYKDLGRPEKIISSRGDSHGNGDSRDPVIGNAGYYVTFESEAANLGVNSLSRIGDENGRPDVYLYTNVRDITLVQSVVEKAVPLPAGGQHPSMSFYANYIVFDAVPPPGGGVEGLVAGLASAGFSGGAPAPQIMMRYLGPV